MTKTHKIIVSIVAVVVLLGIYIMIDRNSQNNSGEIATTTTQNVSTTTDGNIIKTDGTGSYTIEQVPLEEGQGVPQPIPNLNRAAVSTSGAVIAPEARALAESKIKSLQATLKNNPADLESWIYLGIYQKQAGDYDGAVLSWKYAGRLAPNDYISRGNLGNLYAYFIHDNAQAEIYYKEAISKGPKQAYLYAQLADVYKDIFKSTAKARAIIDEGLSKIPNDPVLLQAKANLQ